MYIYFQTYICIVIYVRHIFFFIFVFLFQRIYHHLHPMVESASSILVLSIFTFIFKYIFAWLSMFVIFLFIFVFVFKRIYHHLQPMDQNTIFAVGVTFISCAIDSLFFNLYQSSSLCSFTIITHIICSSLCLCALLQS